jgi:2-polyprenyl-3-methyl-5-hydroxy-6-metoxy-1,4-benzoquinol methylase
MIDYKNHPIFQCLFELGLSTTESISLYHPCVRDRSDIQVLKCQKSSVIFLSDCSHITDSYYLNQNLAYWSAETRSQAILKTIEDDTRRARQFGALVRDKRWLDFGTGAGGILDILASEASETFAVEPQHDARVFLSSLGYKVFESCESLENDYFDIITLFHVYEHLTNPIQILEKLKEKLKPGGTVIIEVPHACDFLIDFLDLDSFKEFTFWSEHLILHTRESLSLFLNAAGLTNVAIQSFQRYPLANHLYWLSRNRPGGHKHWHYLNNRELDSAYCSLLAQLNKTDTLIAFCQKELFN